MKPANENAARPIRLVIVDNDASFLESAVHFLSHFVEVCIVGRAHSAVEALARLDDWRPEIVLMDLSMPGIGGLEATRRIKARPHAPQVVVLTVFVEQEFRVLAQFAGADALLAKEELVTTLVPALRRLRDSAKSVRSESTPSA